MNSYAQNREDILVSERFVDRTLNLLSLGENTGTVLSNALLLIQNNWSATLVEPAPKAFQQLQELHNGNNRVQCINVAVGICNYKAEFYDSGSHLSDGDTSLLSTLDIKETERWGNSTTFNKIEVDVVDFRTLLEQSTLKQFAFISIDCEGLDIAILKQINLKEIGCECLCIEWNSIQDNYQQITDYVIPFGFYLAHTNAENLIFFKN